MATADRIPARIASQALEDALCRRDEADVERLAELWRYYLTAGQVVEIALAALEALDGTIAIEIAEAEIERNGLVGMPPPPFTMVSAEADAWAALSSRAELKSYLVAIWAQLRIADRKAFLVWAGEEVSRGGLMAQFRKLPRIDKAKFLAAAQREVIKA